MLVTIAMHMMGSHSEVILQGKGLNSFFTHLIPNLYWTDAHLPAFSTLLQKFSRFFRYLQKNSNVRGMRVCVYRIGCYFLVF